MSEKSDTKPKKQEVDEHLKHIVQKGSYTLDQELVDLDQDQLDMPKLEDLLKKNPIKNKTNSQ